MYCFQFKVRASWAPIADVLDLLSLLLLVIPALELEKELKLSGRSVLAIPTTIRPVAGAIDDIVFGGKPCWGQG